MSTDLIAKPTLDVLEPTLRQKVKILSKDHVPRLAIMWVGDNQNSQKFITRKMQKAAELGIKTDLLHFSDKAPQTEIIKNIQDLNTSNHVDGIIVQLPLPEKYDTQKVINTIKINKDVDSLTDNSPFISPVAEAVISLIKSVTQINGQTIAIIGQGRLVGQPLNKALSKYNCHIINIDKNTPDKEKLSKSADIVISGTGQPNLINKNWVKKGAIVIDAANGDINYNEVKEVTSYITPKHGAVGPLTVHFLINNVVIAKDNRY